MARALGRKTPPDWEHVEKYPLPGILAPQLVPVTLGINWYEGFDVPIIGTDHKYRIKISGEVRGGHCIAAEPVGTPDKAAWHTFYDQADEGACEGFGHSRSLSIETGRQFDAFWLYDDARRKDGNFPNGEGAYNRDACAALKSWGAHYESGVNCIRTPWWYPAPGAGIKSYHWATNVNEILSVLGLTGANEIPLLNSWGTSYPWRVYIDVADVQRLLDEEGEASVFLH